MASDNHDDWFPVLGQSGSFHCNADGSILAANKFAQQEFFISQDNGDNWTTIPEPTFTFYDIYPASSAILYGYSNDVSDVFCISTNSGQSWINRPIPLSSLNDIASKLSSPLSLFVRCGNELLYSSNGSINWNTITPEFQYFTQITGFCLQQTDNALYAHYGNELAKSTDNGLTWDIVYADYAGFSFTKLAAHPINSNNIYGIGRHSPDYVDRPIVSYDGGSTWILAYPNEELTYNPLLCVDLSDPDFAYFTGVDGIKRLNMGEFTDVSNDLSMPRNCRLISAHPNPFNASTTIQYSLSEASHVTIEIYDLLGRHIETLVDAEMPAGYHQATWDATDQASGMYFYKIQAGEFTETKKMMLLK